MIGKIFVISLDNYHDNNSQSLHYIIIGRAHQVMFYYFSSVIQHLLTLDLYYFNVFFIYIFFIVPAKIPVIMIMIIIFKGYLYATMCWPCLHSGNSLGRTVSISLPAQAYISEILLNHFIPCFLGSVSKNYF